MNKQEETDVIQKMKKTIDILEKWNYEYFVLNDPSVEDKIYDQALKKLKELENQSGFVLPNSPSQKIGMIDEKKFFTVRHKTPMLSLDSTEDYEYLERFDKRIKKKLEVDKIEYLCELKIDGLSASIIYKQGKLTQIITRGDGLAGEDVSINRSLIQDITNELAIRTNNNEDIIEIRGEVYMKRKEFQWLNQELAKKNLKVLANPRNAAAGTLRTLFPSQERKLNFFAYQVLGMKINNQQQCLEKLIKLGFSVNSNHYLCQSLEEVKEYYQRVKIIRHQLDFDIDGIVIKVNNYDYQKKLGQTNKFPRWALAYKFPAPFASSEIKNIQIEITRSGRVSYVAQIDSVLLQGSLITKATLHNYGFIRKMKINIGDRIILKKAGDVIPQIIQIIKTSDKDDYWKAPSNCPSCLSLLKWNKEKIYQTCFNGNCSERTIKSLILFSSKSGMDIKAISEAIVRRLYQANLLRDPADFYYLKEKKPEILKIAGFQKKSVDSLLSNVEMSKKKPFFCLIKALGIPLLGSVKSQKLVNIYPDLSSFIKAIEEKKLESIGMNLGQETQKEVEIFFQKTKNYQILKDLEKIGFIAF